MFSETLQTAQQPKNNDNNQLIMLYISIAANILYILFGSIGFIRYY